ncbi:MAG: TetR family transcriptional regulator [Nevskiales bacterium]
MPTSRARETPVISERKRPRQERSALLVTAILEAAVRVLVREGARRFTTARVAEVAGISVGSLYQYFPNKEAILFRLQADEWKQTGEMLGGILADQSLLPLERLRLAVREFFRSEYAERAVRVALDDAAPLYRDAPEAAKLKQGGRRRVSQFMKELLPAASPKQRAFAADLAITAMTSMGKAVSEQDRPPAEMDAMAAAAGDMLCAYMERLGAC